MSHTPGPWNRFGHWEPRKGSLETAPSLSVGSVHHTEPICRVSGYLHDVEANTNLIAAAPDGLQTAEETYLSLLLHPNDSWRTHNQHVYGTLRDFIAKATGREAKYIQDIYESRAAIAKAEGGKI